MRSTLSENDGATGRVPKLIERPDRQIKNIWRLMSVLVLALGSIILFHTVILSKDTVMQYM